MRIGPVGLVAIGSVGVVVAWAPRTVEACTPLPPLRHTLDPDEQAVDMVAPGAAGVSVVTIERAQIDGTDLDCTHLAGVLIEVTAATDDRTQAEDMGYVVVDSTAPGAFIVPDLAMRTGACSVPVPENCEKLIRLQWSDVDPQTPLDFSFALAAMDLAGNVGPASEPVVVVDPGRDAGGCQATGPTGPSTVGAGALFVALLLGFRKRPPSTPH